METLSEFFFFFKTLVVGLHAGVGFFLGGGGGGGGGVLGGGAFLFFFWGVLGVDFYLLVGIGEGWVCFVYGGKGGGAMRDDCVAKPFLSFSRGYLWLDLLIFFSFEFF